jgi:hypothetical protein
MNFTPFFQKKICNALGVANPDFLLCEMIFTFSFLNVIAMQTRQGNNKPQLLTTPERFRSGYGILEISESFSEMVNAVIELKEQVHLLNRRHDELTLQRLEQMPKDYLTIEEVEKLFDISKRTQQEERTTKKLGYIKKIDGAKILYTHHHIKQYLADYYEESKPTKK